MNFFIVSDLGEENNSDQILIAETMDKLSKDFPVKYVILNGDIHHQNPPMSIFEKLWMRDFDFVYSDFNENKQIKWLPVLGNHEYKGDISKVISFYENHPRFDKQITHHKYYGKIFQELDTMFIFLDTTPLIKYYREHTNDFPDVWKQSDTQQLKWLKNILERFRNKFKNVICFGHHPIYAYDDIHTNSNDMEKALISLFDEYQVTAYISSHVHNFQYIQKENHVTKFVTNSSCSYTRIPLDIDGTMFKQSGTGFTILSIDEYRTTIRYVNKIGEIIYQKDL